MEIGPQASVAPVLPAQPLEVLPQPPGALLKQLGAHRRTLELEKALGVALLQQNERL